MQLLLLLVVMAAMASAAPVKCTPPKTFQARGPVEARNSTQRPEWGTFEWAHDMDVQKSSEVFLFPRADHFAEWFLHDYKAGVRWADNLETRNCQKTKSNWTQHDVWAWLETATLNGTRQWRGRTVDFWVGQVQEPNRKMIVGTACFEEAPSVPLFLSRRHQNGTEFREFVMDFREFHARVDPRAFHIPPGCPQ